MPIGFSVHVGRLVRDTNSISCYDLQDDALCVSDVEGCWIYENTPAHRLSIPPLIVLVDLLSQYTLADDASSTHCVMFDAISVSRYFTGMAPWAMPAAVAGH